MFECRSRTVLQMLVVLLAVGWTGHVLAIEAGNVSSLWPATLSGASADAQSPRSVDLQILPLLEAESEVAELESEEVPVDLEVCDGAIVGRVFSGLNSGQAEPLPDAVIWLFRRSPHDIQFIAGTRSDTDGQYAFDPVRPGRYLLISNAPDHIPAARRASVHPGEQTTRSFLLDPAGPPEVGTIVGEVLGVAPEGAVMPLPGALVLLHRASSEVLEAVADEQGQYVFEEVPVGEYMIEAVADGYHPQRGRVVVPAGETVEFNFALDPIVEPEPGAVEGVVYTAENSSTPETPLPGALVRIFANGGVMGEAVTDEEGYYLMEELLPGHYWMASIAEGYLRAGEHVRIEPDAVAQRDFFLRPLPEPRGACCLDNDCIMATAGICGDQGGDFLGDGTTCEGNPCQP